MHRIIRVFLTLTALIVIALLSPQISSNISPSSVPEQTVASSTAESYKVVRVVDGDTLVVRMDGKDEKVRLIGLDTPEVVDPRRPVQCFGREASDKAKAILTGKTVTLEKDPSQGDRDTYGRMLAYAFLPDGTLFNKYMIEEGYGHEYTYRTPYKYQSDFKQAERDAREAQRGLWAPNACK